MSTPAQVGPSSAPPAQPPLTMELGIEALTALADLSDQQVQRAQARSDEASADLIRLTEARDRLRAKIQLMNAESTLTFILA